MVVGIFALEGIALAILTFFIVPESSPSMQDATFIADIKSIFMQPKVIIFCLFAGLMLGPIEGFADVWGSAFLKQCYGLVHKLQPIFLH